MPEEDEKEHQRVLDECRASLAKAGAAEKGPLLVKMGDVYKSMNKGAKARSCYQQAYDGGYHEISFIERFAMDLADAGNGGDALKMLEAELDEHPDTIDKARLHARMGLVSRNIGKYDFGIEMAKKALTILSSLDKEDPAVVRIRAEANTDIGLILWRTGDFSDAKKYFDIALTLFENLGDKKGIADIYNHLGIMHSVTGEPEKALECIERSRAVLDKARCYINRGLIKLLVGDHKGAEEDFKVAIKKAHDEGYKFAVHLAHMDLAEVYIDLENPKMARTWIDLAYKGFMEMDQNPRISMVLETMAHVQVLEGDLKGARQNIGKALEIAKANDAKEVEGQSYYVAGLISMAEGDYKKACAELEASLDVVKRINHVRFMGKVHFQLAKVYRKLGKEADALSQAAEARKVFEKVGSKHFLPRLKAAGF